MADVSRNMGVNKYQIFKWQLNWNVSLKMFQEMILIFRSVTLDQNP